jgi:hypothetical protein
LGEGNTSHQYHNNKQHLVFVFVFVCSSVLPKVIVVIMGAVCSTRKPQAGMIAGPDITDLFASPNSNEVSWL